MLGETMLPMDNITGEDAIPDWLKITSPKYRNAVNVFLDYDFVIDEVADNDFLKWRKERKIRLEYVAEISGISLLMISKLEKGTYKKDVPIKLYIKFCWLYGNIFYESKHKYIDTHTNKDKIKKFENLVDKYGDAQVAASIYLGKKIKKI